MINASYYDIVTFLLRPSHFAEGYALIKDIIWDERFYAATYIETVEHVVYLAEKNDKKRFEVKKTPEGLKIKATQGHTVQVRVSNHRKYVSVTGMSVHGNEIFP